MLCLYVYHTFVPPLYQIWAQIHQKLRFVDFVAFFDDFSTKNHRRGICWRIFRRRCLIGGEKRGSDDSKKIRHFAVASQLKELEQC